VRLEPAFHAIYKEIWGSLRVEVRKATGSARGRGRDGAPASSLFPRGRGWPLRRQGSGAGAGHPHGPGILRFASASCKARTPLPALPHKGGGVHGTLRESKPGPCCGTDATGPLPPCGGEGRGGY
jgi:hypothetical protein